MSPQVAQLLSAASAQLPSRAALADAGILPGLSMLAMKRMQDSRSRNQTLSLTEDGMLVGRDRRTFGHGLALESGGGVAQGGKNGALEHTGVGMLEGRIGQGFGEVQMGGSYGLDGLFESTSANASGTMALFGNLIKRLNLTDGIDAEYAAELGSPVSAAIVKNTPIGELTTLYSSLTPTLSSLGRLNLKDDLSEGSITSGGFMGKPRTGSIAATDMAASMASAKESGYLATASYTDDSASLGFSAGASSNQTVALLKELDGLIESFLSSLG